MATRDALTHLRERCTRLGIPCTEIQDRAANEAVVDVADPDGTVLRFYWVADTGEPHSFTGLIFNGDAPPQLTTEPRLKAPELPGDNNPIPAAPAPPHTARGCKTGRHRNARICRGPGGYTAGPVDACPGVRRVRAAFPGSPALGRRSAWQAGLVEPVEQAGLALVASAQFQESFGERGWVALPVGERLEVP